MKRKKSRRIFNILGVDYTEGDAKRLEPGQLGLCDGKDKTITIAEGLKGELLLETLIHEVIHGKDFESGLYQVMDRTMLEVNAECVARVIMANFHVRPKRLKSR